MARGQGNTTNSSVLSHNLRGELTQAKAQIRQVPLGLVLRTSRAILVRFRGGTGPPVPVAIA
jgi:hypothetical protein